MIPPQKQQVENNSPSTLEQKQEAVVQKETQLNQFQEYLDLISITQDPGEKESLRTKIRVLYDQWQTNSK